MSSRFAVALLVAVFFSGAVSAYAATPGKTSGLVDIDIKNVPVRQAVETIFEGRGMSYIIEPGVTGKVVELRLAGVTVAEALKSLGDAAGFTVTVEDNVYIIGPKTTAAAVQPVPAQAGPAVARAKRQVPARAAPEAEGTLPPVPAEVAPVTINNYIPGNYGSNMYAYIPPVYAGDGGYGRSYLWNGYYSYTVSPPPYVFGQWANPPPPPGWFSPDVERFLRFEWAVPRRPSFITPY